MRSMGDHPPRGKRVAATRAALSYGYGVVGHRRRTSYSVKTARKRTRFSIIRA